MADQASRPEVTDKPKKRKLKGRKWEIAKKIRISSHTMGPSCICKRLQCFETLEFEQRSLLLNRFNSQATKNEQDAMLASFITVHSVKQRRPRQAEDEANLHEHTYKYSVKVVSHGAVKSVKICFKALLSIFGITKSRVCRIQQCLAETGIAPTDQRGKHMNRPRAFSASKVDKIINHIRSFRGRQSHYSLKDTRKIYLPEELNVQEMHRMYITLYPDDKCSRESYRKIFTEKFNISFGYPRKDTCSTCDELTIKLQSQGLPGDEITRLLAVKKLHLKKGQVFYDRKARARETSQSTDHLTSAAFDFAKNLPCPNISTNDVYYRRQLSTYSFNIHDLGNDSVYLYCYDETVGRKGADDVSSMLYHFFMEVLAQEITHVELFCDSCAGQNKNWTVLRFLHYMVCHKKRFINIKLSFPIRGHSYMECDRDMVCINQKARIETPDGWLDAFRTARKKPSPYNVIRMEGDKFLNITEHIKVLYKASCPMPTRPLREVVFSQDHIRLVEFRENWNGPFESAVVSKPVGRKGIARQVALAPLYTDPLPISRAKFVDLQVLKRFCSIEAQQFFDNLPKQGDVEEGSDSDSDSDISS